MSKKRVWQHMTQKTVVQLLKARVYEVCLETGQVSRDGHVLKQSQDKTDTHRGDRFKVRLYWGSKKVNIAVSRLVWMAKTLQPIPPRFEVHHADDNRHNNNWKNLICVHTLDHKKLHNEEEVPF